MLSTGLVVYCHGRIYSEALTSARIKKLYVEGAQKRGLLSGPVD